MSEQTENWRYAYQDERTNEVPSAMYTVASLVRQHALHHIQPIRDAKLLECHAVSPNIISVTFSHGGCHETQLVGIGVPLPNGAASVSARVAELENAIVNIYRWTCGKRVARECRRVLPDVCERLDKKNI